MNTRRVEIGDAVLYLGDCRDVLPTLPDESVDMIWTDPPYGHGNNDGDLNARLSTGDFDGRAYRTPVKIANDDAAGMRAVVDAMLAQAARVLRCCCCCCCCCCGGGPRPTFAWLAERMDRAGLSFFHSVIWDKINPGLGWRYRRQHEMVMVAHRKGGKLAWADDAQATGNVIRLSAPLGSIREHPNEKPLGLVGKFLQLHTTPGQMVLDPFMGSGTTGVSALQLGRRFIGIELDPAHFETAVRRIEAAHRSPQMFAADVAAPEQMQIMEASA